MPCSWNGDPLAISLLARYLDDKRELSGFATPMRVATSLLKLLAKLPIRLIQFGLGLKENAG